MALTDDLLSFTVVVRYFLHYSGHGGQIQDLDGDETAGFDNCIFPLDHQETGVITDDVRFLHVFIFAAVLSLTNFLYRTTTGYIHLTALNSCLKLLGTAHHVGQGSSSWCPSDCRL